MSENILRINWDRKNIEDRIIKNCQQNRLEICDSHHCNIIFETTKAELILAFY